MVATFTDPTATDTALSTVVEPSPEAYSLEDWLAQDEANEDDLRALLNGLLHRHLRRLGLNYQKTPRRYFFNEGLAEDAPIKREWKSSRTGRSQSRLVAKYYSYGKLKFYRHLAFDARCERFGDKWSIALDPRLHYTLDGTRVWEGEAARSFAIRARAEEYNNVYLNNILFWAHQLARGQTTFELRIAGQAIARANGIPEIAETSFSIQSGPRSGRKQPTDAE
jgi:hypothetical protein